MFFLWTGSEYRNINFDDVEWVKPALRGTQCDIFVKHKDVKEPDVYTGAQASGVLEFVLKRLITSNPNGAMETIFRQVEEEKDLSKHNGNGKRKPRVLKNRELSVRIMGLAARGRWAEQRGETEKALEYVRQAEELKASRFT